jgi:hypothetical protein
LYGSEVELMTKIAALVLVIVGLILWLPGWQNAIGIALMAIGAITFLVAIVWLDKRNI